MSTTPDAIADALQALGGCLRTLRRQRGWSQQDVADRTGLQRSYVSGLERGEQNPTVRIVLTLAQAFAVSPGDLFEMPPADHEAGRQVTEMAAGVPGVISPELADALSLAQVGLWEWHLESGTGGWLPAGEPPRITFSGPVGTYEEFLASIHPDDRASVGATVQRVLATDAMDYTIEYRALQADGSSRWILATAHISRDGLGRPRRLSGTAIDITPRVHAEEQLRRARAERESFRDLLHLVQSSLHLLHDEFGGLIDHLMDLQQTPDLPIEYCASAASLITSLRHLRRRCVELRESTQRDMEAVSGHQP